MLDMEVHMEVLLPYHQATHDTIGTVWYRIDTVRYGYMVYGIGYMVYGARCMVYGVWCMAVVYGVRYIL